MSILDGKQEREDQPLLPSVRQWIDWKLTNVLPKAGGTLDQDPEFMRDFRIIANTEASWQKLKMAREEIKREIKGKL